MTTRAQRYRSRLVLLVLVPLGLVAAPTAQADRALAPSYLDLVLHPVAGSVESIAQTRDGFLWFGTHQGLIRFDGVERTPVDLGACGPAARRLYAASDGSLYIAHGAAYLDRPLRVGGPFEVNLRVGKGGLSRLHEGRMAEILPCDGQAESWVWALAETGDGSIWSGSEAGLLRLHGGRATPVSLSNDGPAMIAALYAAGGDLWAGAAAGLAHLRAGEVEWSLRDRAVTAMTGPAGGPPRWLASFDGVFSFDGSQAGPLHALVDPRGVLLDREGTLFTWRSTSILHLHDGELVALGGTPTALGARSMFRDRDGALWMGLKGGGVAQLPAPGIRNLRPASSEPLAAPEILLAARDGRLYAASPEAVSVFSRGKWTWSTLSRDLRGGNLALSESRDGGVWLSTSRLYKIGFGPADERPTAVPVTVPGLPADAELQTTFIDSRGDLWLATRTGEVVRFPSAQLDHEGERIESCVDRVTWFTESDDGTIWLGGPGGLGKLQGARVRCYGEAEGLAAKSIQGATAGPDGGLWLLLGDDAGMAVVSRDRVTSLPASSGVPRGGLYRVARDRRGGLWVTSNRGVYRLDERDLVAGAHGLSTPVRVMHFDAGSGLLVQDCQNAATPAVTDTGVFIATVGGISFFPIVSPAGAPPTVLIDDVIVDGIPRAATGPFTVGAGSRSVSFHFTAPYFIATSQLRFQYRLDGFDSGWTDAAGVRLARYAGLSPGPYAFRVRVLDPGSSLDEGAHEVDLSFTVQAPWWAAHWFRISIAALTALLMAALGQQRRRRVRDRERARQLERTRIARELHDGLAQAFLAVGYHLDGLRMKLTSAPEDTRQLLEQTRTIVDRARDEARQAIAGLRQPADDQPASQRLQRLVDRLSGQLEVEIAFRAHGASPQPDPAVQHELEQIVREAITNAVKHGQARSIHVSYREDGEDIVLEVTDDGVGLAGHEGAAKAGFGLTGMKERADALGGTVDLARAGDSWTCLRVRVPRQNLTSRGRL